MAEFLIKAISATNADLNKDKRGCYKRGDIVEVRPDGAAYGKEEGLPKFVIVKIPGLAVETALKYMAPSYVLGNPEMGIAERREWNVLVDDIPNAVKNQLLSSGEVTVTLSQVRNYIKNKFTGLTA